MAFEHYEDQNGNHLNTNNENFYLDEKIYLIKTKYLIGTTIDISRIKQYTAEFDLKDITIKHETFNNDDGIPEIYLDIICKKLETDEQFKNRLNFKSDFLKLQENKKLNEINEFCNLINLYELGDLKYFSENKYFSNAYYRETLVE